MTINKIAIYGAIPDPPPRLGLASSAAFALKHSIAFRRDAKGFLSGDLSSLDYRNYLFPNTVNIGDLAIVNSIAFFLKDFHNNADFDLIRWGELDKQNAESWSDLIIAGSGYITLDEQGNLPQRLIYDIEFIRRNNIRPILFGVGINHPSTTDLGIPVFTKTNPLPKITKSKLRELLSLASAISVRDIYTQTTLSHFSDKPVELVGDPALHYGHLAGINHLNSSTGGNNRPLIGININFHGPNSTLLIRRNLPIIAESLKVLQEELRCDFRYFVHFDTERAIQKLLQKKNIRFEVIDGGPDTLARGYAALDLHIGGMLHSCILAHSVDTPAIALAYDIKHAGFMDLFGLRDNCLPSAELTSKALIEHVQGLLAQRSHYTTLISRTRQHLMELTNDFIRRNLTVKLSQ